MSQIKNLIFDLGGVIINLDINKTISEFNTFSNKPFETIYTQLQQNLIFDEFDKGNISPTDFFTELQKHLNTNVSDERLINAWNAMLLDFPKHRLDILKQLKTKYRLFLLSNTNETHVTAFEKSLYAEHQYENLEPFFEKVYYSCRIGMRKPNKDIFNFVLSENNLKPSETLFFDDTIHHINGANKTGIQAHLLEKGKDITTLIAELSL
jgi:glucose-1-phosphatase